MPPSPNTHSHTQRSETGLAFTFEEGELVHALRNGHWVLLDEVNLASTETLQVTIADQH